MAAACQPSGRARLAGGRPSQRASSLLGCVSRGSRQETERRSASSRATLPTASGRPDHPPDRGPPVRAVPVVGDPLPLADVRLLAPVLPSKVVAIGRNYAEHAKEMGGDGRPRRAAGGLPQAVDVGDRSRRRRPVPGRRLRGGRLRGGARRRHRAAVPRGAAGTGEGRRARLHLRQRRHRARPAAAGSAVGPRQGLRHVLPDRPVGDHRPRPSRPRDHDHRQRRAQAGRPHLADGARRRRAGRRTSARR